MRRDGVITSNDTYPFIRCHHYYIAIVIAVVVMIIIVIFIHWIASVAPRNLAVINEKSFSPSTRPSPSPPQYVYIYTKSREYSFAFVTTMTGAVDAEGDVLTLLRDDVELTDR